MSSLAGAIVAAVVAGVLAVGTTFGIVTTVNSAKPSPVEKPLIVYGNR